MILEDFKNLEFCPEAKLELFCNFASLYRLCNIICISGCDSLRVAFSTIHIYRRLSPNNVDSELNRYHDIFPFSRTHFR